MSDFRTTTITDLAAIVASHLEQHDIGVVLVGGLAVEIYTGNLYLTKDIDMVNTTGDNPSVMSHAMAKIGFHKEGRVYANETTEIAAIHPAATRRLPHFVMYYRYHS